MRRWIPSGLYTSKVAVKNGAEWWRSRGYKVKVRKVRGGWKHYRRER